MDLIGVELTILICLGTYIAAICGGVCLLLLIVYGLKFGKWLLFTILDLYVDYHIEEKIIDTFNNLKERLKK